MKKYLLSLLLVLAMVFDTLAAHWNNAMLRLREERGRAISVTINGRRFSKISRSLTIGDLRPGVHNIKIFRYNSNGSGWGNAILAYQGNITVRPGRIYYITVSRNFVDIDENCCIDDYGHWNNNDNWDIWDNDMDSWNNNHQWDHDHNNNFNDNTWDNFRGGMSNGRYNQLIEQIRNASFESSKVSVANTALRGNTITVSQLVGILREFSFESTRLQFAKDSYQRVSDRRNYHMIYSAFTFQSSKDELDEFLRRQQR